MVELVYPELSYKIVGVLFSVFKQLGGGLQEKIYQRALRSAFQRQGLSFAEQVRFDIEINGESIGRYYFDFVIEEKIVLEIKSRKILHYTDFRQVYGYLKKSGLKLGLLAKFGNNGVEVKRILKGL